MNATDRSFSLAMARTPDSTVPSQPVPAVVIVSPTPEMLALWRELLQGLDEVPSIQLTDISSVTTAVARWRPLAILVEQELFEFDEQEFDELARDVGAELFAIDGGASKEAIVTDVMPKLRAALVRWRCRKAAR